jgi:ATP-binding cassette subfamily B protein
VDHALALVGGKAASSGDARRALVFTAVLLVGVSVMRGLTAMLHSTLSETIAQRVAYRLRMDFYEKLQRLSFKYHDRAHVGDLMTLGILDIEFVRQFYPGGVFRTVFIVILVAAGAFLLLSSDLLLGLVALSFVPFVAWRAVVARLKLRRMWDIIQDKLGALTTIMEENLGGLRVVRAFAAQDHEIKKFDATSDDALEHVNHAIGVRVRNDSVISYAFLLSWAAMLWFGGVRVISGDLTVGELTRFMAFMGLMMHPVRQLGFMVNSYARASSSGGRVFELLDLESAIKDKPDAPPLRLSNKALRFDNVFFGFRGERFLERISFEARPGHTIGIVGPPGSGKSTVAHLVPRFYDVTGGRITIDGQDIRDVTLESLRHTVSVVQQDTFMFTTTIFENVAYGDPSVTQEVAEHATAKAQLADYIRRLPKGYETVVGERGVSLSGGQRQRMSIARAVMLHPSVLIFDDSTAAIDAATENRIRAALKGIMKDTTVLIISHRLSSLMHCDEILFIEKGHIVERGSHEQLISLNGKYRDLYELQIKPSQELGEKYSIKSTAAPAGTPDVESRAAAGQGSVPAAGRT